MASRQIYYPPTLIPPPCLPYFSSVLLEKIVSFSFVNAAYSLFNKVLLAFYVSEMTDIIEMVESGMHANFTAPPRTERHMILNGLKNEHL